MKISRVAVKNNIDLFFRATPSEIIPGEKCISRPAGVVDSSSARSIIHLIICKASAKGNYADAMMMRPWIRRMHGQNAPSQLTRGRRVRFETDVTLTNGDDDCQRHLHGDP